MRPEDRDRILVEVTHRVVDHLVGAASQGHSDSLEELINDTLYHEHLRLEKEDPRDPTQRAYRARYERARQRMKGSSFEVQRDLVSELARHFVEEVVGNFNPYVYQLATRVIPAGLSLMLRAGSARRLASPGEMLAGVSDHMLIQGEVDHIQSLLNQGTLMVVPTHSSNLDSMVLGYAAYLTGIPPLLYGAGLNLFSNPVLSFFMGNLGAYRVDRKKRALLYKEVLKAYSTSALEFGYHSLFFPGGTRSRSGEVERHLKKGLLGTAVQAYIGNLQARKPNPDIYIVPCTLSYKLVLEAETLIADHLKETGKSRYIIEDDEFSKPRKILNFMSNLVSLDDRITITFSRPMDVFGNPVDFQGQSLDPRGRRVDPRSYVTHDGAPVFDAQRDHQYTTELASEISRSFLRDNVIMSTHLVSHALFQLLLRANPSMDLYRLLRTGGRLAAFPMAELHRETERVLGAIQGLDAPPRLSERLAAGDIRDIVADALKHYAIYHSRTAAVRRGDRVFHQDRNLLLYYGNRLRGYDLGRKLAR